MKFFFSNWKEWKYWNTYFCNWGESTLFRDQSYHLFWGFYFIKGMEEMVKMEILNTWNLPGSCKFWMCQLSNRKMKLRVPTAIVPDHSVIGTKTLCKTVCHDSVSGNNFKFVNCWGWKEIKWTHNILVLLTDDRTVIWTIPTIIKWRSFLLWILFPSRI